jgi:hypothetical protein
MQWELEQATIDSNPLPFTYHYDGSGLGGGGEGDLKRGCSYLLAKGMDTLWVKIKLNEQQTQTPPSFPCLAVLSPTSWAQGEGPVKSSCLRDLTWTGLFLSLVRAIV